MDRGNGVFGVGWLSSPIDNGFPASEQQDDVIHVAEARDQPGKLWFVPNGFQPESDRDRVESELSPRLWSASATTAAGVLCRAPFTVAGIVNPDHVRWIVAFVTGILADHDTSVIHDNDVVWF